MISPGATSNDSPPTAMTSRVLRRTRLLTAASAPACCQPRTVSDSGSALPSSRMPLCRGLRVGWVRADPGLPAVRAASFEIHEDKRLPDNSRVIYRGPDEHGDFLLKYAMTGEA